MVSYGNAHRAYIGITTPSTITSSSLTQFKDESGAVLYSFHTAELYDVVQDMIDSAEAIRSAVRADIGYINGGESE